MAEGGPTVEAVVFDVGNVLIEWDRGRLYRRLIPDVHVREHFFAVHALPHLASLVTYQETPVSATAPAEPNRPKSTFSAATVFAICMAWSNLPRLDIAVAR